MSHLFYFILFISVFLSSSSNAQIKWDGGGGDDQWNNALNWAGNIAPGAADNVVIDNSVISGNYSVILPSVAVTVKSILINPTGNNNIELILPKSSTVIPALTITGPGYGLTINKGGIFRNSSGASSGTPLIISDSIRINNDGRFIINTPRAHATNVDRISRAPGTESGILEFDIPDPSTTISLSGRTYGKLVLRAASWGNTLNYTAAGTTRVVIRSDLEIGDGVNFNLNFSDTLHIKGNLKQDRSTFNLGNTARSVVLAVGGNITQASTGLITETGTGMQQILLNGNAEQQISVQGQIINQVSLTKDGSANAKLLSGLSLSYRLILRRGNIISSPVSMLMLLPECTITADSLSSNSYIDGPMRKMGLGNKDFLFPVGGRNQIRWVQLKNAAGDFTVEYFHSDPYGISDIINNGIDHISGIEYWNISGDNSATATVKLSFSDPYSGGVTDLANLRVARLENGEWENAGSTDFRGAAGSNGWVSSSAASGFSAENNFFALASAISQENPLPISEIKFHINRVNDRLAFSWEIDADDAVWNFELQESSDNIQYKSIYSCPAIQGKTTYQYEVADTISALKYYRLKAFDKDELNGHLSKTLKLAPEQKKSYSMNTMYVKTHLNLRVSLMETKKLDLLLYNTAGQLLRKVTMNVQKGITTLKLSVADLPQGAYFLMIGNGNSRLFTSKFVKGS